MLRNPVYFIFLILFAVGAYVTYTLNLWGPMYQMANAAFAQALVEGKKWLREFLESSEAGRQAMAMEGRNGTSLGEGIGMRMMDKAGREVGGPDEEDVEEI